jgi:hypothetical protein
MKKIIIPFDGGHFSKGAFLFAQQLHQSEPVLLTGVFLPEVDYARFLFLPTAFAVPGYLPLAERYEEKEVDKNIQHFSELCEKNFIEYRIHKNLLDSSIPKLTKETRFADLMILGSETFYKNGITYGSDEYMKAALHNTECPVIIVPEKFNFPSSTILAYDGSGSSVFAIRQFAYLFPELTEQKTILVYCGDEKHTIPDEVLIEELAARHFKDLTITKITADHKNNVNEWFIQHKDSLVVSGSFGRSGISELLSKSFIMDLIKEYQTPLFIAHQ